MRLLVTGGAGYLGTIVATELADGGHEVVVLDDLSTGHADAGWLLRTELLPACETAPVRPALAACAPGAHRVDNSRSGSGYSNREVPDACRKVTGRDIPVQIAPHRPGDPAVLTAWSEAIAAELGWRALRHLPSMVAGARTFAQLMSRAAG